jgi:hypothetical protein
VYVVFGASMTRGLIRRGRAVASDEKKSRINVMQSPFHDVETTRGMRGIDASAPVCDGKTDVLES